MAEKKAKDNMELWNSVCKTDPTITKKVEQRGGFTAICAQSQIKRATELWGPYGSKWGVKNCKYGFINLHSEEEKIGITLTAIFYFPDPNANSVSEFEIASDMYYKPRDDCMKKLLTDLTTKALSKLGFNSDVFEGKFDDSKYVDEMEKEFEKGKPEDKSPKVKPGDIQPTTNAEISKKAEKLKKAWTEKDRSQTIKLPPNTNQYFTASEIKDMENGKKIQEEILEEMTHREHLKKNWDYLTPPILREVRIIRNNPELYDWSAFKESTLDNDIFKGTTDDNRGKIIKSWKTHNKGEK